MWIIVLSFILLSSLVVANKMQLKIGLKYILLIGILLRILVIILSIGIQNYDLNSYKLVGEVTLLGHNIYPAFASLYNPYLPAFLYLEALASFIQRFGIDQIIFLKSTFALFDIGIVCLVYKLANRNKNLALLYALNPISIFITCFHGQFDSMPLFFLLLSIVLFINKKNRLFFIVASIAVLIKTWPLLFLLPILKQKVNKFTILFILVMPLVFISLYVVIFHSSVINILTTILKYRGVVGYYGIPLLIFNWHDSILSKNIVPIASDIFLLSYIIFAFKQKKKDVLSEILGLLLFFFIFTIGYGMQWLIWIVPFLIIKSPRYLYIFFITATIYIATSYYFMFIHYDFLRDALNIRRYWDGTSLFVWLSIILISFFYFNLSRFRNKNKLSAWKNKFK